MGKAPLGVGQLAQKHNISVKALAGGITQETSTLNQLGITSYFSIVNTPMSLEQAMDTKVPFDNLRSITNQIIRLIQAVKIDNSLLQLK